jgi:hypothetical protein
MRPEIEMPMPTNRRRRSWELTETQGHPLQRAWSTVNKARMVFGLAAAAIVPCAAFWFLLGTNADHGFDAAMIDIAEIAAIGMCWFIGVGSLFLAWAGRTYGAVSRFNCLALCATLTFSMPLFLLLVSDTVNPSPDAGDAFYQILGAAFVGMIPTPINLLGGWLLWRVAIRPAAVPLEELAEVF